MQKILIAFSIAIGVLIAYVDSRPNWDDTGITAVAIFAACFLFAAFDPVRPWLWALCVGVWIPLAESFFHLISEVSWRLFLPLEEHIPAWQFEEQFLHQASPRYL